MTTCLEQSPASRPWFLTVVSGFHRDIADYIENETGLQRTLTLNTPSHDVARARLYEALQGKTGLGLTERQAVAAAWWCVDRDGAQKAEEDALQAREVAVHVLLREAR
jgi:hypothetical protein